MPPSYEKQKLILKIYIRLLLYIKDKYNEIGNASALLQHLTNKINLINQDEALDKIFYNLFIRTSQRELETTSQTGPKVELQEDIREKMSEYMEQLIESMKAMKKEEYVPGDDSETYLDRLEFPKNLKDLTTLQQVLEEHAEYMRNNYNDDNTTKDIRNTIRIIGLLFHRVEIMVASAKREEDRRKQEEQAGRLADEDDDDDY
jgi:uncharacterized protein YozE (UPF0346 family)